MFRCSMALAALALLSAPAAAQDAPPDREKLRKEILEKVRARIHEEHTKIMERLGKILDEELSPAPVPGTGGDAAKRVRELQKKLQGVDDQRDDILREIRGLKRETADAKIRKEAETIPADDETVKGMFDEYMEHHTKGTESLKSHNREEGLKEFDTSIAGFKKLYYRFTDVRYGAICAYNVACGYALIGQSDQALDWIEFAMKAGYTQPDDFDHMRQDSDLDGLRNERRYQRMMLDK